MPDTGLIIAALFLPLFPLGMVFNVVLQRLHSAWQRALLLLLWPLPGVWLLHNASVDVSNAIVLWSLFSALLYGFRAVVVRDLNMWTGFMATSAWSLVWLALAVGVKPNQLVLHVLAFSVPLVMLTCLAAEIERRYESVFAGIVSGVAQAQPRLSGALLITMLAAIASPLFPGFFSMLGNVTRAVGVMPYAAVGVAAVWLLWSWSGARLLQDMLVGSVHRSGDDLGRGTTTIYIALLMILFVAGLYLSGVLL